MAAMKKSQVEVFAREAKSLMDLPIAMLNWFTHISVSNSIRGEQWLAPSSMRQYPARLCGPQLSSPTRTTRRFGAEDTYSPIRNLIGALCLFAERPIRT